MLTKPGVAKTWLSLSFIHAAMASEETVALRISTGVPHCCATARLLLADRQLQQLTNWNPAAIPGALQISVHSSLARAGHAGPSLGTGRALYYHGPLEATLFQIYIAAACADPGHISPRSLMDLKLTASCGLVTGRGA